MHLKPLTQTGSGMKGEFTIEDLVIFSDSGRLAKVARMWSAITKYALTVDRTHSAAVDGVKRFLSSRRHKLPANEDGLDDLIMAELDLQVLSDSDSYVVKSLLFLLLVAFNEFSQKQVYMLIKPPGSRLPCRNVVKVIAKRLRKTRILPKLPANYRQHFLKHLDPVRNNFAHGDWGKLGRTLKCVDLSESFVAVAQYFHMIQENLRRQGFKV